MCGRYNIEEAKEMKEVVDRMLRSSLVDEWHKRSCAIKTYGEICPTDVAPVIASNRSGKQSVFPMRWGFHEKSLLINARVETASQKPTFKNEWKSHRCIVPASYYYEWEHLTDNENRKTTGDKYVIQPEGDSCTWLCGLYRFEDNMPVFVILTRSADDEISFIHDRMPLIMPGELVNDWISPDSDPEVLVERALTNMIAEKA